MSLTAQQLDESLPKKWEVHSALGAGGQGTVFKGTVDGATAALKVFHDAEDTKRVAREVEALRKLQCPHVVRMLGFCTVTIAGRLCQVVAYEYLDGGDLTRYLGDDRGLLTAAVLGRIARDMCKALDALWSLNIVHRDVKPANIVEASDGRYVLVDLAFARHLDQSSLTETGWTVGTRGYMSPEHQRAWKNLTVDADVYSLGVTLHELATRALPNGTQDAIRAHLKRQRADLGELADLIAEMLAPVPYNRPQIEFLLERLAQFEGTD
ncbi:MAG: serine/threonine protein kinase [Polyangiaceae bacterium]|nr:serine/threonine protein kinase [Polyangiaceae bacterium]